MYIFIRFTGIFTMILGIALMLASIGGTIYGFWQNDAIVETVNVYLSASTNLQLLDARPYVQILSLAGFIAGLGVATLGQLLLACADTAMNSRETNLLLRSIRRLLEQNLTRDTRD
jgi:hypothetical protein